MTNEITVKVNLIGASGKPVLEEIQELTALLEQVSEQRKAAEVTHRIPPEEIDSLIDSALDKEPDSEFNEISLYREFGEKAVVVTCKPISKHS